MFWTVLIPHLTVSAVFIGLLVRALRRYDRHVDAIIAKLDEDDAASQRAFDVTRDEIKASMRAQVDAAIAEMEVKGEFPPDDVTDAGGIARISRPMILTFSPHEGQSVLTEEEIRTLPRGAQVAFAARCARRVLPLVEYFQQRVPEGHLVFLRNAVGIAETSADRLAAPSPNFVAFAATAAGECRAYATSYVGSDGDDFRSAADAADSAYAAAYAASPDAFIDPYADATRSAMEAGSDITNWIDRDFKLIRLVAKAEGWADDTPVPPSVFGPLWLDGAPERWPKPEKSATELRFAFGVPDDMTTHDAIEFVKELSAALCALHLAGSGHGLAIQPPLEITAPVRTGSRV